MTDDSRAPTVGRSRPRGAQTGSGRRAHLVAVDAAAAAHAAPRDGRTAAVRPASGRLPRGRVWTLVIADVVALLVAGTATFVVAEQAAPPAVVASAGVAAGLAALALLTWIGVFCAYRLYDRQPNTIATSNFDEIGELFHALLAGSLLFLLVGQALYRIFDVKVYSPVEATLFLASALVAVPACRYVVRTFVMPTVMAPRRALILGAGTTGRMVERKIAAHPHYGLELVGFLDDDPALSGGMSVIGPTSELTRVVEEMEIDWVILTFSRGTYDETLDLVRAVRRPDVHLSIVPSFYELFASNATIEDIEGLPVVSLPPMRFSRSVVVLKRAVDLVAAVAGLILLAPLFALVALAIKLDSRGPVFFRQRRWGRGGREFRIVKFRTMVDGADAMKEGVEEQNDLAGGPLFKIREDPRITRTGGWLRRTSLDELPQLWNVLRGEMSLVGPRPFVVDEAMQITGWAGRRVETTPGITGLWQVLGRTDLPFEEMVKLDYIYVTNWSLWWDIKILFQTIPAILARRGAY